MMSRGALDELRSLLDTAGAHRPMLATMALAGLRVGEVCTFRWRDVKLASSQLRVADAKTDGGVRTVDLSPALLDELKAHRQRTAPASDDELVFMTRAGTPRDCHNVRARVLRPRVCRARWAIGSAALALEVYAPMMKRAAIRGPHGPARPRRRVAQTGTNAEMDDEALPAEETKTSAIPLGDTRRRVGCAGLEPAATCV
jgi:integrase